MVGTVKSTEVSMNARCNLAEGSVNVSSLSEARCVEVFLQRGK